jgi:hypothetical protein
MKIGTFDVNEFIKESKFVLQDPKSYFSTLKLQGGITEPLMKALIYGAVAGIFVFLWSLLNIGNQTGMMFGGAVGIISLIWYAIAAVIGLFIGAVILLVISSICRGNTDFEANARVTAATMVLLPLSAFLGFVSAISISLGTLTGLAINLYGIWLFYNGLVEALKAKQATAKLISYVLVALVVLTVIMGMGARKKSDQMMKDFGNRDVKELMKEMEKE